jgi:hypothetical protein
MEILRGRLHPGCRTRRCSRDLRGGGGVRGAGATAAVAAQSHSEDSVKAAYLYRFTQYIEWPTAPAAGEPFTIAVLNAPGVARGTRASAAGSSDQELRRAVRVITRVQDLGHAQMLYLGAGARRSAAQPDLIDSIWAGAVGDGQREGLEMGSVLNFITVDSRVRFEVSLTAADRPAVSH